MICRRFIAGFLVLLSSSLMSGCSIGPQVIRGNHIKYNDAVQVTASEEMLLNLVRVTYREPAEFLAISGITDQHEVTQNLALTPFFTAAGAGEALGFRGIVLPQAGASGAIRPTITYTPLRSEEFTKRFLAPLGVETIYVFTRNGRKLERALRVVAQNINGVKNNPDFPSDFEAFLWLTSTLGQLAQQQQIEIAYEEKLKEVAIASPQVRGRDVVAAAEKGLEFRMSAKGDSVIFTKKDRELVLRIAPDAINSPEVEGIVKLLNLEKGRRTYNLKMAIEGQLKPLDKPQQRKEIMISTRSVDEIFDALATGIDVPAKDAECGLGVRGGGSHLSELRVHSSNKQPRHAAVAVHYRGHWFFIDNSDWESRKSFEFLVELYNLEIRGGGAANPPALTLSVSK